MVSLLESFLYAEQIYPFILSSATITREIFWLIIN